MEIRATLKRTISKVNFFPVDLGGPDVSIILAGMGRSGTTWAGSIINYDDSYRVLFEPFLPTKVKEAKGFEYIQYLDPGCNNVALANQARAILTGKVRNNWVDRENRRLFYRRRMLKDIRCNLMLGWLRKVANAPPIVLMIRHPLQVVSSWKKLGWGKELIGKRSDLDIILSQKSFLKDFPILVEVMKNIDREDFIQHIVFLWCIYHFIPSEHLKKNAAYALHYESLLSDADNELARLFLYLDKPFNIAKLKEKIGKSSSTNFRKRNFAQDNTLNGWKDEFSTRQIQRSNDIIAQFGLNDIYDNNGLPTGTPIFRN